MGRVEVGNDLAFDEEAHRYLLKNRPIPGLTSVLTLTGFVDKTWFTEEGRDRGTRVHAACQYLAEDELDWATVGEDILPRVKAFERFLEEYKPTLLGAEWLMASRVYGFGCRHDFLFDVPALGGPGIYEVKTGAAGLAAKLQTAGQKVALEENFGFKNLKRFGFELNREGKARLIPHTDSADRPMILNAVAMVNRRINEDGLKI